MSKTHRVTRLIVTRAERSRGPTPIQFRFWRACDRALAARVPSGDRNGPAHEPVTLSGYYTVPTVSGRPAWARIEWIGGSTREAHCTYDPDAERKVIDLVVDGADPTWADDGSEARS